MQSKKKRQRKSDSKKETKKKKTISPGEVSELALQAPPPIVNSITPEVFEQKLWPLPFHDFLMTIIPRKDLVRNPKSTDGNQAMTCFFYLTLDHANLLHCWENATIFIRFCLAENPPEDEEYNEDLFPPGLELFINGRQLELAADRMEFDRKNYSKPLELDMKLIKLNNILEIKWNDKDPQQPEDPPKNFILTAGFYIPVSPHDLCRRVVRHNPFIPTEKTVSKTNEMLTDGDAICASEAMDVSIMCPILKKRIRSPSKGYKCTHQNCFDLFTFVDTYRRKFKLRCPLCNVRLNIEDISIDSYFLGVLKKLASKENVSSICLKQNGEFTYTEDSVNKPVEDTSEDEDDVVIQDAERQSNIDHQNDDDEVKVL